MEGNISIGFPKTVIIIGQIFQIQLAVGINGYFMVLFKIGLCGFTAFLREIIQISGEIYRDGAASSVDDLIGSEIFSIISGRNLYGITGVVA